MKFAGAQLYSESDRGCALVGGAMLDEALAGLLRAYLISNPAVDKALLTNPGAPLSTFSARVATAMALGLLSDELYHDLEQIRKIRNLAAHFDHRGKRQTDFAFSHQDISDKCRALNCIPAELQVMPPRIVFILLVVMVASVFAEHAANANIVRQHAGRAMAVRMLLSVSPTVPYKDYLSRFFASAEIFNARPTSSEQ